MTGVSSPPTSPPGLDLDALTAHLRREAPDLLAGPLQAQLVAGGRSNLTYLLTDGRTRWVLRRPPLGHVLETAHDMGREHRVMSALAGTAVPVPEMVVLCTDPSVLGAPFYVMSYVDGTVYRDEPELRALDPGSGRRLAGELVTTLAALHEIDPAAVGLGALGRPEGYLERQVRRWSTQLAASHSRDVPGLAELGERLARSVPTSGRTSLVHGDYKLDNVVVGGDAQVLAVLDWEMATLGDPLTDLVNVVLWWDGVRDTDGHALTAVPADVEALPASSTLLEGYAAATGADLSQLPWYTALACFKLAAIFEGMHHRQTLGLTVGEGFDGLAGLAPALARRGADALHQA